MTTATVATVNRVTTTTATTVKRVTTTTATTVNRVTTTTATTVNRVTATVNRVTTTTATTSMAMIAMETPTVVTLYMICIRIFHKLFDLHIVTYHSNIACSFKKTITEHRNAA